MRRLLPPLLRMLLLRGESQCVQLERRMPRVMLEVAANLEGLVVYNGLNHRVTPEAGQVRRACMAVMVGRAVPVNTLDQLLSLVAAAATRLVVEAAAGGEAPTPSQAACLEVVAARLSHLR